MIALFKSSSASWNAFTISTSESKAAGSEFEIMLEIVVANEPSADCALLVSVDTFVSKEPSAEVALLVSVETLLSKEVSAEVLLLSSLDTLVSIEALATDTSVEILVAKEPSAEFALEVSVDNAELTDSSPLILADVIVLKLAVNPEISPCTKPIGVVIWGDVNTKSDWRSNTILVFAIVVFF